MKRYVLNEENKVNLLNDLVKRSTSNYPEYEKIVADICENVKENKDAALFEYTKKFDKFDINKDNIKVTEEEIDEAVAELDPELYAIMEEAAENIKPRVIIEKYMVDDKTKELSDYKFYGFNGSVDYVMVCVDRNSGNTKFFYIDSNWKLKKNFSRDGLKYGDKFNVPKPKKLDEMFKIARILSKDIPFVSVDLYYANDKIYFGELTFFPSSGFDDTRTPDVEEYLAEKLKIEE